MATLTAGSVKKLVISQAKRQGCVFGKDLPYWMNKRTFDMMERDVKWYISIHTVSPRAEKALNDWINNLRSQGCY